MFERLISFFKELPGLILLKKSKHSLTKIRVWQQQP